MLKKKKGMEFSFSTLLSPNDFQFVQKNKWVTKCKIIKIKYGFEHRINKTENISSNKIVESGRPTVHSIILL